MKIKKKLTIFYCITAILLFSCRSSFSKEFLQFVDTNNSIQGENLKEMSEGRIDAPITIIEYASLICTHCAEFHGNTLPKIREKYIKTGKVRFIFREFAYEENATAGFVLARCVPEEQYFPMLEILFQQQGKWAFIENYRHVLLNFSKLAGLNENDFNKCFNNKKLFDALYQSFQNGEKEFGIEGVPFFSINGKKYIGALSFEEFSKVLEKII